MVTGGGGWGEETDMNMGHTVLHTVRDKENTHAQHNSASQFYHSGMLTR